ncbi:ribosomal-processing cysteine protease Prp [Bacillus niameyensis]|uniref:ribosomal-processing cysteine protease Prp n=1 Tax=Bacillus niameyensis TaxID=1522308 RepID=UPI000782B5C1|nr:ribosomal-processing cysteine protease Prp [Bacillus niameyensis]
MIRILIERTNNMISSFTMEGHADFAEKGQDIVCAGVSAVAFGSVNAVMALTGVEPEIEQTESGFLKCSIPEQLEKETSSQVQLLLDGMVVSLQTIEREYGEYLKLTYKK